MKYPMYSYRDLKGSFMIPFIEQNEPSAVRGFEMMVKQKHDVMAFSPADFELYEVGFFDTDSGQIDSQLPRFVVAGSSLV